MRKNKIYTITTKSVFLKPMINYCRVLKSIPLIPALKRAKAADLCEFEANPIYRVSARTTRAT